jgi:hypothetical protein
MGWAVAAVMGAQAVGGIVSAAGANEQASANATAARYQSAVAENNAAIARNNALMATRVGEQKATQQEMKNRGQMGAIVAAQAGNGVDVNTGSAKRVQDSAHVLGRLDTETIKSDAAREAHAYETQARGFDSEAKMLKKSAKQYKRAGKVAAFSSLLDTAISMGGTYLAFGGMGGSSPGAPTPLSTGANVLDTSALYPIDTGTIY